LRRQKSVSALLAVMLGLALLPAAAARTTTVTNALLPGTRFATAAYIVQSETPGPTVMIVGGAHGNEPAGAHAAEIIRHWPVRKGKLVVVPRANIPALATHRRTTPGLATNLNNLNRNFPRAGQDEPARGEQAIAIWALALEHNPDWMLDLHEGYDFNAINSKSVGSSVIVTSDDQGKAAADLMLAAVNATISDPQLKFARRGPPINASLARAAGEHLKIPGMTLETTLKQPLEKRVRQHEIMVHALLQHVGMMPEHDSARPRKLWPTRMPNCASRSTKDRAPAGTARQA
jgi:predicted deacylase